MKSTNGLIRFPLHHRRGGGAEAPARQAEPAPSEADALICAHLQHEGLGSVYERVVLGRFFRQLVSRYDYASVLEYGCHITKGYDNLAFLEQGLPVTVASEESDLVGARWRFRLRPAVAALREAPPADLVWNFAQVQLEPGIIDAMLPLVRRHLLVFVPNILNVGTPFHLAYHLVTRTRCQHAERGSIRLRTRAGLLRLLAARGVDIIASGYVDAPPIPDIGFSIRELKQTMGWAATDKAVDVQAKDPTVVWGQVKRMMRFEDAALLASFKPLFGHHIFALGSVR